MAVFIVCRTGYLEVAMLNCFPNFLQYINKGKNHSNNSSYTFIAFYMPYTILNVSHIKLMITLL